MYFTDDSLFPDTMAPMIITAAPFGPEWLPGDADVPLSWDDQVRRADRDGRGSQLRLLGGISCPTDEFRQAGVPRRSVKRRHLPVKQAIRGGVVDPVRGRHIS